MLAVWRQVFVDCAKICGWAPDTRNLPVKIGKETLSQVQHHVSHVMGDRAGTSFLTAFDISSDRSRQGAAHMLYASSDPSSRWVIGLSSAPSTCLSSGDFVLTGRHLGVATKNAKQPCQCGVTDAKHLNHAIVYKITSRMAMLCHDVWASAWCCAARHAY